MEMDINFLGKGIIIGLSIAVPVGPIGVLCVNRTLAQGRISGLVSGLGAATADAIYSCIDGFGFTFIKWLYSNKKFPIGGIEKKII
jgi:threonine/homoserine/homoserine lactone efflux protein